MITWLPQINSHPKISRSRFPIAQPPRVMNGSSVPCGSACDRHLTRLVGGKPPFEVRFPQTAARQRVLRTQAVIAFRLDCYGSCEQFL
ncbi:hypothetical protein RZS08_55810, partial [Arthrospira platensis SPKY1]|nr:hypothetical protein [Arthrospira platensis SPKY1]